MKVLLGEQASLGFFALNWEFFVGTPFIYIAMLAFWFIMPSMWRLVYSAAAFLIVFCLCIVLSFEMDGGMVAAFYLIFFSLFFYFFASLAGFCYSKRKLKWLHSILTLLIVLIVLYLMSGDVMLMP